MKEFCLYFILTRWLVVPIKIPNNILSDFAIGNKNEAQTTLVKQNKSYKLLEWVVLQSAWVLSNGYKKEEGVYGMWFENTENPKRLSPLTCHKEI